MERFDAMLDDPDGWRGWYCGPRDGRFGPRDGWHGPRDGWREGPRDGRWAPRHHWGGGHFRPAAARTDGTAARVTGTDLPTRRRENI